MRLSLSVWAPIGKEAWWAGRSAIESGSFVFAYTPDGHVFSDLKLYAAPLAADAVQRLQVEYPLTSALQAQVTMMYIHVFVNGALEQFLAGAGQQSEA
jgi:hypothetical protein